MKYIRQIWHIVLRELDKLLKNRIYGFFMVVFPSRLV